LRVLLQDKGI